MSTEQPVPSPPFQGFPRALDFQAQVTEVRNLSIASGSLVARRIGELYADEIEGYRREYNSEWLESHPEVWREEIEHFDRICMYLDPEPQFNEVWYDTVKKRWFYNNREMAGVHRYRHQSTSTSINTHFGNYYSQLHLTNQTEGGYSPFETSQFNFDHRCMMVRERLVETVYSVLCVLLRPQETPNALYVENRTHYLQKNVSGVDSRSVYFSHKNRVPPLVVKGIPSGREVSVIHSTKLFIAAFGNLSFSPRFMNEVLSHCVDLILRFLNDPQECTPDTKELFIKTYKCHTWSDYSTLTRSSSGKRPRQEQDELFSPREHMRTHLDYLPTRAWTVTEVWHDKASDLFGYRPPAPYTIGRGKQ